MTQNPPNWPPPPQQPWGYPPPQQQPWGPPPQQPPGPNRRKPLLVTGLAALVVVTVASIIGAVVFFAGRQDSAPAASGPATEVARAYLQALADGDAETALSFGASQPASRALLTDEILRRQLDLLPITDIEIFGEETDPAFTADDVYVRAAARFGDERSEGLISMVRIDGQWKLRSSFVNALDAAGESIPNRPNKTLEVFGEPIGQVSNFYVFPGALEISTSSPYMNVSQQDPFLIDALAAGDTGQVFQPEFTFNAEGEKAVDNAVASWITDCLTPGSTPTAPCSDVNLDVSAEYVPGTGRLTGPVPPGNNSFSLVESLDVLVTVSTQVPMSAQRPDGVTDQLTKRFIESVTVDLALDPPAVTES